MDSLYKRFTRNTLQWEQNNIKSRKMTYGDDLFSLSPEQFPVYCSRTSRMMMVPDERESDKSLRTIDLGPLLGQLDRSFRKLVCLENKIEIVQPFDA